MRYTVILKNGKVIPFFIRALAETYVVAYGGILIDNEVYSSAYAELLVE